MENRVFHAYLCQSEMKGMVDKMENKKNFNIKNTKIAFLTLGCKVNSYETEAMQALLLAAGAVLVEFSEKADIYVVNTCSVTNMADRKSRQMLHRAKITERVLTISRHIRASYSSGLLTISVRHNRSK